jgi:hypothetical protein
MRVFYRGPRALITDEVITVARTVPRSFLLADLSAVHIVRQQARGDADPRRTTGVSVLVSGVLLVPIIGPVSKIMAIAIVVAMAGYALLCFRTGPPAHNELVATHRGRLTVVFESDDRREFDQVCRGMQRALERVG